LAGKFPATILQNKHDMAASIARTVEKWTETAQVGNRDALHAAAGRWNIRDLVLTPIGDKLVITGRARYQLDCDYFWDAIRELDRWECDVVVDLAVDRRDIRGLHTVRPGETLASIAKRHLGSAAREWDIFEANRDRMNDPDQIFPGQELVIPRR
jgi:nucleoid-associated protein YgaU